MSHSDSDHSSEKTRKRIMEHHPEELKTVTIRGVDKELYDRFLAITKIWGHSAGFAFSSLIKHYQKEIPFGPGGFKKFFLKASIQLEIIENLEELRITKEDLISGGENIRYCFRNIRRLVFSGEINSQDLLKHVHNIVDCEVTMPKDISSLILYSLIRSPIEHQSPEENLRDVTIRNVSVSAYDEFVSVCQLKNQKIGDVINDILAQMLPRVEVFEILMHKLAVDPLDVLVITSITALNVNRKDLMDITNRKVFFHRIGSLEFSSEIEKSLFINSVVGIYNCESVKLPPSVPKLIELSRVKKYP